MSKCPSQGLLWMDDFDIEVGGNGDVFQFYFLPLNSIRPSEPTIVLEMLIMPSQRLQMILNLSTEYSFSLSRGNSLNIRILL